MKDLLVARLADLQLSVEASLSSVTDGEFHVMGGNIGWLPGHCCGRPTNLRIFVSYSEPSKYSAV